MVWRTERPACLQDIVADMEEFLQVGNSRALTCWGDFIWSDWRVTKLFWVEKMWRELLKTEGCPTLKKGAALMRVGMALVSYWCHTTFIVLPCCYLLIDWFPKHFFTVWLSTWAPVTDLFFLMLSSLFKTVVEYISGVVSAPLTWLGSTAALLCEE